MSNIDIISIKALNMKRTPADGNKVIKCHLYFKLLDNYIYNFLFFGTTRRKNCHILTYIETSVKLLQATSFFIKGEITKIMCQQQWHYMGCPKCLKQVRMIGGYSTPRCDTHRDETGEAM